MVMLCCGQVGLTPRASRDEQASHRTVVMERCQTEQCPQRLRLLAGWFLYGTWQARSGRRTAALHSGNLFLWPVVPRQQLSGHSTQQDVLDEPTATFESPEASSSLGGEAAATQVGEGKEPPRWKMETAHPLAFSSRVDHLFLAASICICTRPSVFPKHRSERCAWRLQAPWRWMYSLLTN